MKRFCILLAVTAALLLFLGIASPAASFMGIGVAAILVIACAAALYGPLPALLLTAVGTILPLVIESYGAQYSWRLFASPLATYFTRQSLLFAFDTSSGVLIFVLAMSIVGSFVIARSLTRHTAIRVTLAAALFGISVLYTASPLAAVRTGVIGALIYALAMAHSSLHQPFHPAYMHMAVAAYIAVLLFVAIVAQAAVPIVVFLLVASLYVGLHLFSRSTKAPSGPSAPHAHA